MVNGRNKKKVRQIGTGVCTVDSKSDSTWNYGNFFRLKICVGNANALN